jgi:hypothetical protein
LPSGMMVVVGWMIVPDAERSTGSGDDGFLVAAPAGRADEESAESATSATAVVANLRITPPFHRISM